MRQGIYENLQVIFFGKRIYIALEMVYELMVIPRFEIHSDYVRTCQGLKVEAQEVANA